jgi:ferredoxin-NADP reductase
MKLPRRQFLHLAAGVAALPAMSHMASAQAYPARPVRVIVGFPADRAVAFRTTRPAIRHRQPSWGRQQYRRRDGRACALFESRLRIDF